MQQQTSVPLDYIPRGKQIIEQYESEMTNVHRGEE